MLKALGFTFNKLSDLSTNLWSQYNKFKKITIEFIIKILTKLDIYLLHLQTTVTDTRLFTHTRTLLCKLTHYIKVKTLPRIGSKYLQNTNTDYLIQCVLNNYSKSLNYCLDPKSKFKFTNIVIGIIQIPMKTIDLLVDMCALIFKKTNTLSTQSYNDSVQMGNDQNYIKPLNDNNLINRYQA